ncbi:MAG: hypothetical protein CMJ83_05640 [Planctomycetes bacterium]|nr:hypothetical protein [Planctomycetota bacterium]
MFSRTLVGMVMILVAAPLFAQGHWSQFRGPGGRGLAVGAQSLPTTFGPTENLVWKQAVSRGHASPCIRDDRVFIAGERDGTFEARCFDRRTGKLLWERAEAIEKTERMHRLNGLASSTPVADEERVYFYCGSFGLRCFSHDGKDLWRHEVSLRKNTFGTAASPILAGGRLILNRDTNDESWCMALDPKTGKVLWRKDRTGFPSGWSTPTVWKNVDVDELLVYGAFRLTAYDVKDGAERWSVPGLADEPCITPVTGDGLVFVSSYNMRTNPEVIGLPTYDKLLEDYDKDGNGKLSREEVKSNQSILSRLDADGEGDHPLRGFFRWLDKDRSGELDAKEWGKMAAWLETFKHANACVAIRPGDGKDKPAEIAWQFGRGVPEVPSPLYCDGRIYLIKNGGLFTCLDAKTGTQHYQGRIGSRGPYYASPLAGDGKIYTASARGVITVLKAGGEKIEVLARNDLGERIMSTPALLDGRIYVRTEKALYVFGE